MKRVAFFSKTLNPNLEFQRVGNVEQRIAQRKLFIIIRYLQQYLASVNGLQKFEYGKCLKILL